MKCLIILTVLSFFLVVLSQNTLANTTDVSTLAGKVMTGYQGWFDVPTSGYNRGWFHYARIKDPFFSFLDPKDGNVFRPDSNSVEMFPDLSECDDDERYPTDFRHRDGRVVGVYSSANQKTVVRHFKWMRDYGIDGAYLQRFVQQIMDPVALRFTNRVLENVRAGAQQHRRSFAIMYDLSGITLDQYDVVVKDWDHLTDTLKVSSDEMYQRHKGKPLVALWGIGFNDRHRNEVRAYLDRCAQLIQHMKNKGFTVIIGVPTYWRELTGDAVSDPYLHEVIKKADIVNPWYVGRFANLQQIASRFAPLVRNDNEWTKRNGLEYLPMIWPGFSWSNLFPESPFDKIPRLKGRFIWEQVKICKAAGVFSIYNAMFDEVNEGTAIFKVTEDIPVGGKWLTNEGLGNDFYLKLVGNAGRCLRGEINCDRQP